MQLALMSLGLREGEIVIVPAVSFVATVNPVIHLGAEPLVLDVEEDAAGLSPECLTRWLERETISRGGGVFDRSTGRRVFGMIAVHLHGIPCRIEELQRIADRYGLVLIEDNAQALGARSGGRPTGGFGDASIVSFNGNKTVTAGGGGMVVAQRRSVVEEAAKWADHCRPPGSQRVESYGFNLRISNLQAAVGLAQVERLDELVAARRENHRRYEELFRPAGLKLLEGLREDRPSYWLNVLRLPASSDAGELVESLRRRGIAARRLFAPFHRQELYARFARGECPVADRLHGRLLGLPSSAHLSEQELERVASGALASLERSCGERVTT